MKKHFYVFVLLAFSNLAFCQNQFSDKIKSDCETMNNAAKNNNYEVILDYTYPKIIEMAGGREKLAALINASLEKMKKDGYVFEEMIVGEPQKIYKAGNELHCIVPKETIVKAPKGRFKATYYFLAISKDGGKKWYFIESHMLNAENKKQIFPNFNNELVIPQNSDPILID